MDYPRITKGRGRLYESILDTIGDTPCVRVKTNVPDDVRLYVKAEFFNPASSVKDRLAISIIEEAEHDGLLKPGQTVIEATSGNTGSRAWLWSAQQKVIHLSLLCRPVSPSRGAS